MNTNETMCVVGWNTGDENDPQLWIMGIANDYSICEYDSLANAMLFTRAEAEKITKGYKDLFIQEAPAEFLENISILASWLGTQSVGSA